MTNWETTFATALVGTERRPLQLETGPSPIDQALGALDYGDQPGALLGAIAIQRSARRAGQQLSAWPEIPLLAPCDLADLPTCSLNAASFLATMLSNTHAEGLAEWLGKLAQQGQRVPETLLIALLDYGRTRASIKSEIRAVLGLRGQWLAQLNPAWGYTLAGLGDPDNPIDPEHFRERWETSSGATRRDLFVYGRSHAPELMRTLLSESWPKERADFRHTVIQLLIEEPRLQLNLADEACLEAALDDRSEKVRQVAAQALARLPGSALIQRMIERMRSSLHWSAQANSEQRSGIIEWLSGSRSPAQTIEWQSTLRYDPALRRDGMSEKAPVDFRGTAEEWWGQQMLERIPPGYWAQEWAVSPQTILAAAARTTELPWVLEGFTKAMARFADRDWIDAALELERQQPSLQLSLQLVGLPADLAERVVQQRFSAGWNALPHEYIDELPCQGWTLELSQVVLNNLAAHLQTAYDPTHHFFNQQLALDRIVLRLTPATLPMLIGLLELAVERWPVYQRSLEAFCQTAAFRAQALAALETTEAE